VVLAQFDGSRWIAVLLSSDGDPVGGGLVAGPPDAPAAAPKRRRRSVSAA
jgi:AI-2 transport protein TqsA